MSSSDEIIGHANPHTIKKFELIEKYVEAWAHMRSHHVKEVAETLHAVGIELRYLPPYSPDMNPIEMLWSKVKALLCVSQRDCVGWFKADGYCP